MTTKTETYRSIVAPLQSGSLAQFFILGLVFIYRWSIRIRRKNQLSEKCSLIRFSDNIDKSMLFTKNIVVQVCRRYDVIVVVFNTSNDFYDNGNHFSCCFHSEYLIGITDSWSGDHCSGTKLSG